MTVHAPATLERDGIAQRIPHAGRMCLLERLEQWDAQTIRCIATSHHWPDHPMRTDVGLLPAVAIEYAAQAMALHGGLLAAKGRPPSAGYIASVRSVRFGTLRLDEVAGDMIVCAERLAGDERQVMYAFEVTAADDGALLAAGRAVVVLNTPLPPDTARA